MNTEDRVTRSIEVSNFDQIALQAINVENEVVIQQAERESLTIEARPDVFAKIKTEIRNGQLNIQLGGSWSDKISAALATSLTRPRIKYAITVRKLIGLDIAGMAHMNIATLETDHLAMHFKGIADVHVVALKAKQLDIDVPMPGACQIEVSGRVSEQRVSLSGMSDYNARRLESHQATIALKGPGGHAVVRVEDELDVTIGGPGRVEYYGQPRVTKKVSPLGVVSRRNSL